MTSPPGAGSARSKREAFGAVTRVLDDLDSVTSVDSPVLVGRSVLIEGANRGHILVVEGAVNGRALRG